MGDDDEARFAKARSLALSLLNRRERSVAEVRAHLARRDVAEATAEAVVDALVDECLIDDERFAQAYVADKRELQAWGSERIRRGLAERGVDPELAEWALAGPGAPDEAGAGSAAADGPASEPELARALTLLRRRFPDPPRERRDRDRALGMLLRRGYESELALDALAAHARGG